MKNILINTKEYVLAFLKWIFVSVIVGVICGLLGSAFHIAVDIVTEIRSENIWIIALLPLGGLVISAMYSFFKKKGNLSTNRVIDAAKGKGNVPFVMAPLIFISTVITHLLGGSAGREGAALQLGGSLGYNAARILRINENQRKIVVMAGMSGVFAALFGTPLTAAVFSMEVMVVGAMNYSGIIPCIFSAYIGYFIANLFGLHGVHFQGIEAYSLSLNSVSTVIFVSLICALAGILFCVTIHKAEHISDKFIPNKHIRALVGGGIIVILTFILGTTDYNGAGMDVIEKAILGQVRYEAFILKIIFTAITIAAGFKGGEIVPAFFIGSTLGCAVGTLLGFDASFCASIGFVSVFCSVVNCPIASLFLAIEVFGADNILLYAIVCAISFMMSGKYSLYSSQELSVSKTG